MHQSKKEKDGNLEGFGFFEKGCVEQGSSLKVIGDINEIMIQRNDFFHAIIVVTLNGPVKQSAAMTIDNSRITSGLNKLKGLKI